MADSAARISHGLTSGESGTTSFCPAWISDGLCTVCRLTHHSAGQSPALPSSRWAMALSESPARTVAWWLAW